MSVLSARWRRLPAVRKVLVALLLLGATWWLFCLPGELFRAPQSTELLDREGNLLSASIAADGQWRFPAADSISPRLKTAVVAFEDRRFYRHWGVSPRAIIRALRQNIREGSIVEGGSTLTMQVARMARGNRARTLVQKFLEAAWATRLEWRFSKGEILDLWLNNAPFGGNAVGIEAATRRYYGRSPASLSWGEAATLAVLPNSPGLIHPGRDRGALRARRNALLDDLAELGNITSDEAELAKLEELPRAPRRLPRDAPHLLQRLQQASGPGRYRTSIDGRLQTAITSLAARHQERLAGNEIHNLAVMVSEVNTGNVIAYLGNAPGVAAVHSPDVDIIRAPRSPGSLLKPMLYGLSLQEGTILRDGLLADVPTSFQEFTPANFYQDFDGAVPASEALVRSLNIPFVYLLKEFGVPRFYNALKQYGFDQVNAGPDHYGLSLILGGGEITMEEIHTWFLGMARQQRYFYHRQGKYCPDDFLPPTLLSGIDRPNSLNLKELPGPIGAGAGHLMLEAMQSLERPDESGAARRFSAFRPIAWKTGTSFGFRDAWAVGCTPEYVVSVWTGNADGEGRPGLVGVRAAAPLLFGVFRMLQERNSTAPRWFEAPYDDLLEVAVCEKSGFLAGPDCPRKTSWQPANAERSAVCSHHQKIFTTPAGDQRVRADCSPGEYASQSWFILPGRQAYFYRKRHPEYQNLPPWHPACVSGKENPMQVIYPHQRGSISPSRGWDGEETPITFEVAHRNESATVYWHLNDEYLGSTRVFHTMAVEVGPGRHLLSLVDTQGNRLEKRFDVK
ncbi:penicillin-binding protein 1C [Lewinella sp. W8]|nr:penicillin-binding protein 1C [Lewinella sp. W8]